MQLWQYCLLVTARLLYMFRALAVTNTQYYQSRILLVLYIILTYDARKLINIQYSFDILWTVHHDMFDDD